MPHLEKTEVRSARLNGSHDRNNSLNFQEMFDRCKMLREGLLPGMAQMAAAREANCLGTSIGRSGPLVQKRWTQVQKKARFPD